MVLDEYVYAITDCDGRYYARNKAAKHKSRFSPTIEKATLYSSLVSANKGFPAACNLASRCGLSARIVKLHITDYEVLLG